MARGDPLIRQWRLLRFLTTSGPLSVQEIAVSLGEPARTVYRDLEVLREAGFNLWSHRSGKHVTWDCDLTEMIAGETDSPRKKVSP